MKKLIFLLLLPVLFGLSKKPIPFAFAATGSFTNSIVKTSASTWQINYGAVGSAGDICIIAYAVDNISTGGGNTTDHVSVSNGTQSWTKLYEHSNAQAAAGAVTVSIWWCKLTGTVGSVTLTLGDVATAKAASMHRFTVASGKIVQLAVSPQVEATDGADVGQLTLNVPDIEHLFLRVSGQETPNTFTASTNYTGGTTNTSGGGAASNIGIGLEYRILTGTSDNTNPTGTAADNASIYVALTEVDAPTATNNDKFFRIFKP